MKSTSSFTKVIIEAINGLLIQWASDEKNEVMSLSICGTDQLHWDICGLWNSPLQVEWGSLSVCESSILESVYRSKKLITQLYHYGISISYDRIMEIEEWIATSTCERFVEDGVVSPASLWKGVFTVGALDT